MKYKKNDSVIVTAGKDRGKTGKIESINPSKNSVLVSGVNFYTRHQKRQAEGKHGSKVQFNRPLPVGNISLICPNCKKPTRIGLLSSADANKIRTCRKCKSKI